MPKEQFVEGKISLCDSCPTTCCDDDKVEKWANEYFAFHERMKDYLISLGIEINFAGDRARFKKCLEGKECKFLKYSLNKDIDPRPIDCKIYPFAVDWNSIDFDKKIVKLYYWDEDCPVIRGKKKSRILSGMK